MKNEEVVRLYDLYANDLYRLALSYLGSKQDAEDVVQDVYLKLLNKVFSLKSDCEKSYLMKMTANRCKNMLSSSAYKTGVDLETASAEIACFYELTDHDKDVYEALMAIDDSVRVPIYLFYYEGYQYNEIAKILNLSDSAVAMRIKRGKEHLKEKLERLS